MHPARRAWGRRAGWRAMSAAPGSTPRTGTGQFAGQLLLGQVRAARTRAAAPTALDGHADYPKSAELKL